MPFRSCKMGPEAKPRSSGREFTQAEADRQVEHLEACPGSCHRTEISPRACRELLATVLCPEVVGLEVAVSPQHLPCPSQLLQASQGLRAPYVTDTHMLWVSHRVLLQRSLLIPWSLDRFCDVLTTVAPLKVDFSEGKAEALKAGLEMLRNC